MARPGTWDLDLDGDFQVADGPESVALRRLTADGTYAADVTLAFALREVVNKRSVAGQMEAAELVWHLDADQVGSAGVRRGDVIVDGSGVEWTVGDPSLAGASDQWRCPCLRSAVRS